MPLDKSMLPNSGKEHEIKGVIKRMDVVQAIGNRRSIRKFKPDAVPKEILDEILRIALRTPSWSNTQPWEFAIVCGKKLEEIKKAFVEKSKAGEATNPDLPPPKEFPEPFNTRRRALSAGLYEIKGIKREDMERRRAWRTEGLELFGAPSAIYIFMDRSFYLQQDGMNVWPVFDCGLVAENIMLLLDKA